MLLFLRGFLLPQFLVFHDLFGSLACFQSCAVSCRTPCVWRWHISESIVLQPNLVLVQHSSVTLCFRNFLLWRAQVIEDEEGLPAFKVTSSEEPNAPITMDSPALCWQQVCSLNSAAQLSCIHFPQHIFLPWCTGLSRVWPTRVWPTRV